MSSNLFSTEPGGEQTQYERDASDVQPHAKVAGQLGDPATGTSTSTHKAASNVPNTQGITPADKIRYGQSIQEGGVGGKTSTVTGETAEDGFGGTEALEEKGGSVAQERRVQGYGGSNDMDRNIGA
ncbi:hypothetical protein P280DRAFT_200848 [Massarina eburnea CBS 473.64]|uniref:Uncharacterized protein n=1 Tax=Massarina eburnea CBS 473.64 TaxID=1395130 RepID=A0A6A6RIM2_9PLEO|nr:hypothetical protein P280DRAFT_200848 [Massarina eburnea CBS 473.64]